MSKVKSNQENSLEDINMTIQKDFFYNHFRINTAATKTFILLLASKNPKNIISGQKIDLDKTLQNYNRSEFHHIYPKSMLRDKGIDDNRINILSNFCFISSSENKNIGKKHPLSYLNEVLSTDSDDSKERLDSILCEKDFFSEHYEDFIKKRTEKLIKYAVNLINGQA